MPQRQPAGQRGDQEGPGKGSVGIGQKLQDLAGQATKGPGGAGGNEVGNQNPNSVIRTACCSKVLPAAATATASLCF